MTYGTPQTPDSHPANGYGYSQPTGPIDGATGAPLEAGNPPASPYASGQTYGAPGKQMPQTPRAPKPAGEKNFIQSMFDLTFRSFITVKFAAVIYVLLIAQAALTWLSFIIFGFLFGGREDMPWLGIVALLLGWIPAVIQIIYTRVVLEFLIAQIRTAQNTTALVEHAEADARR